MNNTMIASPLNPTLWERVRKKCYDNYHIILAFMIPMILLFAAYACFKVYPFGDKSVLALDLNAQYVYYFDHMHEIFAGKESIFYSWNRNLSGEFMGIIGYYLASPFNFLVYIFPREMITEGLLVMMLAKAGAIGACMAFYLDRAKNCTRLSCVMFSSLYALCAYSVVQTMNPMWLDGVGVLPLVCLGIESLVKKSKFKLLVITLIYAFVSNFYIGFMIGIFSAIYYIYYMVASGQIKKGCFADVLLKSGLFSFSAISAVLSSCFMILPVYKALQNGKFNFSEPNFSFVENFDIVEILQKLFPNSYDTVRMIGMPFLYCGTIVLILIPLYFFCRKFSLAERIGGGILVGLMILFMFVRPADMLWHGGQMPNWLPYRYSFMVSFLLVAFAAQMFDKIRYAKSKSIGLVTVGVLGLAVYIQSLDTAIDIQGKSARDGFDSISVFLPAVLILVIMAFVVLYAKKRPKITATASIIMVSLICAELAYSTTNTIFKMNADITFSTRDSYLEPILPLREAVNDIKEQDDGFYRMEKTFFRTSNDPMALNMYGLSHSSSTLNARPIKLLDDLGFTSRSHNTRYFGATPITSDIFGVKYILHTKNDKIKDIKDKNSITVEKNEDALDIAYLVDSDVMDVTFKTNVNPFANQEKLVNSLIGEEGNVYFETIEPDSDVATINLTEGKTSNNNTSYKVQVKGEKAQLTYNLTATKAGHIYMFMPTNYERASNLYVNGTFLKTYFESDNHHIADLGEFEAGEKVELEIKLTKDDVYFKDIYFMTLDTELYQQARNTLAEYNKNTVVKANSTVDFTITTNSDTDKVLFTTIPAEEGWEITIDGKKTEYDMALDSLISVPVSAGRHTIELKFTAAGWHIGLIFTACGVGLFIAMIFLARYLNKPLKIVEETEAGFDTNTEELEASELELVEENSGNEKSDEADKIDKITEIDSREISGEKPDKENIADIGEIPKVKSDKGNITDNSETVPEEDKKPEGDSKE